MNMDSSQDFGVECVPPFHCPDSSFMAEVLLEQSGQLYDLCLDPDDEGELLSMQVEILSMQLTVSGIRIVARNGQLPAKTFYLKAIPTTHDKSPPKANSWRYYGQPACRRQKRAYP